MKQATQKPVASRSRYLLLLLAGIGIVFVLVLLHIGMGKVLLSPYEVLAVLVGHPIEAFHWVIVWDLRLPRTLIGLLAGAMLGLAGAILQALLRNPLAEPGIIGVSSGGVLALVLCLTYLPALFAFPLLLPLITLSGGLLTIGLVYLWSRRGSTNPLRLILTGILLSAVSSSLTSLIMLRSTDELSSILLWTVGSLNAKVWSDWNALWPWAIVTLPLGLGCASLANLLHLGDEVSTGLGMRSEKARILLLLISAMLTAAAVSVVGAIGFIGLLGPHIARRLVGEDARRVFPLSAVIAAGLLVLADLIAVSFSIELPFRAAAIQVALPVGAVTALLGAPFFLFLLKRSDF